MVTEPVNDFDGMDGADAMPTEEPGFFQKYKLPLLAGAVIFVALLALIIRRLHKKKQEKERDETI